MAKGIFGYGLLIILAITVLLINLLTEYAIAFWVIITAAILQILILLVLILKQDGRGSRRSTPYYNGGESSDQEKEIGGGLHESRI